MTDPRSRPVTDVELSEWRTLLADVRVELIDVRFHHATPARLEESLTKLDRVLRALEEHDAIDRGLDRARDICDPARLHRMPDDP